jgi:AP-3 complex subunit sigma
LRKGGDKQKVNIKTHLVKRKMIKAILIFNTRGQARMLKFFESRSTDLQQKLLRDAYQIVSKRDVDSCNFVEYEDYKLIYRHYATLYFVFAIDSTESEYDIYEVIHVFVQSLDQHFENVCELDLIFHSDKVNQILNEFFMGGFIVERSPDAALSDIRTQVRIERQDTGVLMHVGSKIKSAVDTKAEKVKMDVEKKFDMKL